MREFSTSDIGKLAGVQHNPDGPSVINPAHYQGFSNGAEAIDITENLTFNCGNAVKYLARAGRIDGRNKGEVKTDLKKARWYVSRELERIAFESEG